MVTLHDQMFFCGYFVLSNGLNGIFCIIPIFGVDFGHTLGILPPGVTLSGIL